MAQNRMIQKSTGLILAVLFTSVFLDATLSFAQKVLIINSYHAEYPWVVAHNTAMKNVLKGVVDLSFFDMDTKRLPKSKYEERVALALAACEREQPDVVVLTDDNALKELGGIITQRGTPVVYLGINDNPRNYPGSMDMATGVLERPLLKRSIVYLKTLMGDNLHRCLVLFDNGTTAHATFDYVFQGRQQFIFSDIVTDIRLINTLDEWKETVLNAQAQGYDAILIGLYHTLIDKSGKHVDAEDVIRWTSLNSPIPPFGFWDFSIGKDKAVGGFVLAGEPQGTEAAKLVMRILSGENASTIQPVTAEQGRLIFSHSELLKWNLTLPAFFHSPSEPLQFVE